MYGQQGLVHRKAGVADQCGVAGIDAFKCGEAGGSDLYCPAAKHDLAVEGQENAVVTGSGHGKGGTQIVGAVGEHVDQRQLRAGENDGNVDVGQHEGNGGGGVAHGVCAVGYHDAVEALPVLPDALGDELPFGRTDIGGVQGHQFPDGDIIVGPQLVHFPLENAGIAGLQAVATGHGGNGATGGKQ